MEENSHFRTKMKKRNKAEWYSMIGISLLLTAIFLTIWFFMRGETIISGDWPEQESSESLSCEIEGLKYPFSAYDNSERKTTKVSIVFINGNLKTISLIYQLYYNGSEEIEKSEAENHAAMNLKMQNDGAGPDALELNFAKLANSLKMSLYAEASELDNGMAKYFELEDISKFDLNNIKDSYEKKNFGCTIKNE